MSSTPERRSNPRTPAQIAQRSRITRASRGYAALTPTQVQNWARYAATTTHTTREGQPFTPNGYQSYSSLAATWYAVPGNVGSAPPNPPAGAFVGDAILISAQASSGAVTFVGSGPTGAGVVVEFWLQPLRNANRRPAKGAYRVVGYAALAAGDGNKFSVATGPGVYAAQYRLIEKASGRKTALTPIPVTGVALELSQGGTDEAAEPSVRRKKAA